MTYGDIMTFAEITENYREKNTKIRLNVEKAESNRPRYPTK